MYEIDKIFAKALEYTFKKTPRGTKAQVARQAGITAQKLNDILTCRRGSDEDDRRKLAAALGYPCRQYEDFLDLGRRILAGEAPEAPVPAPPPPNPIHERLDEVALVNGLSDEQKQTMHDFKLFLLEGGAAADMLVESIKSWAAKKRASEDTELYQDQTA